MYCRRCGKELGEGAKFCDACGAPAEDASVSESAPKAAARGSGAPQKRSRREPVREKPPNIFLRLLFIVLGLCLLLTTSVTVLVFSAGRTADGEITSARVSRREHSRNRCYWDVAYEFSVDGKLYEGRINKLGSGVGPQLSGYRVIYMPFAPEMNRLTDRTTIAAAEGSAETAKAVAYTALYGAVGYAAAYLLLHLAFPGLPLPGAGKRKKRGGKK